MTIWMLLPIAFGVIFWAITRYSRLIMSRLKRFKKFSTRAAWPAFLSAVLCICLINKTQGASVLFWSLGWFLLPMAWEYYLAKERMEEWNAQWLPTLHLLHGQIDQGLSLASAIKWMGSHLEGPVGRSFRAALFGFESGENLGERLNVLKKHAPRGAGLADSLLMLYQLELKGLSLKPAIVQMILLRETLLKTQSRAIAVWKSAKAQLVLASFCPILIFLFMAHNQTELIERFSKGGRLWLWGSVCLVWMLIWARFFYGLHPWARNSAKLLRIERRLSCFHELSLYCEAGIDFSYAWRLCSENTTERLEVALESYCRSVPQLRPWTHMLNEQYRLNAPMTGTLRALTEHLRRLWEEEVESNIQSLPTRLSLILVFGFFPPSFCASVLPVLFALTEHGAGY